MKEEQIFAGLNPEQRRAVEAVRGPVVILAGAGSGKTTTITRRIANQVLSGAFQPSEILAVTFTDKAAGEMRDRLARLGVQGVKARTFHSAALAQLRNLAENPPGQILASKAGPLRQLANSLPAPYRFRPSADLANEIEWAKNRRLTPSTYAGSLGDHEPPIPVDLMQPIFRRYEERKNDQGLMDFEDILGLTIQMFDRDEYATERFRARYSAFTVDEYQDVNLLQQSLLDRWLGPRDDVCAVGDDYQSIYSFTGASPSYLLGMPRRWPRATVVRLEENYRSTPEVLDVANRLVPNLGGAEKTLRPTRASGPQAVTKWLVDAHAESLFVVERVKELQRAGVPLEEMAVIYRANFRSEDFEEAFSSAGIAFQVRDGAFLNRIAARRILAPLQRSSHKDVAARVRKAAERDGWMEQVPDGLGDQETTRQADFARLVSLAEEFDDGTRTGMEFVTDMETRFGSDGGGRGVNLLTYHRAKGLEFDAVFLPRLIEGEVPFKRAKTDAQLAEERRLLYVGITRAKSHLFLTWTMEGRSKPSRFLTELGLGPSRRAAAPTVKDDVPENEPWSAAVTALKSWRLQRSRADEVPAYVVMADKTLKEIARNLPRSEAQLAVIPGIGPTKLERYGKEILSTVGSLL